MIKRLTIKQFAIIDDIDIDFYTGLTVLTGETGAGKSIIIDAISLLLGERADNTMIRNKADQALVEGVFSVEHPLLKPLLDYHQIDYEEDIVITRILSKDNQNHIKINSQRVTLKLVNEIAGYLADIHSQFDTTILIHPEHYIELIDGFRKDKVKEYLNHYQHQLKIYQKAYQDYLDLKAKKSETLKQLDLYQFQLKELRALELNAEEYEELQEKIHVLDNIDKINYNLAESMSLLDEGQIIENVYRIKANISDIEDTSKEFKDLSERINNIYYELKDIMDGIEDKQDSLDYDPNEFESMNERLNDIEKIQKKYQKSISELIEYQTYIEETINDIENYDERIKEKEASLEKAFIELKDQAMLLSHLRQTIAKKMTKDIIESLQNLEIKDADFDIDFKTPSFEDYFDKSIFKQDGVDQVDFLISTNKGEPLKPLSKTASGGEMSRVMLTFKTIFAKSQQIPTIIFDEIDTGISGYVAKKIGRKISETAQYAQVIAITHIPQVVAEGIHHLDIKKETLDNSTKISAQYLNYEARIETIAQMMSADQVTDAARDTAKQLLVRT